jgi:hypothetical protein
VWSVELRRGLPLCGKAVGALSHRGQVCFAYCFRHGIPKGRVPLVGCRATPYKKGGLIKQNVVLRSLADRRAVSHRGRVGFAYCFRHGIPKGRVPLVGRRATPYKKVDLLSKACLAPFFAFGDSKPLGLLVAPPVLPLPSPCGDTSPTPLFESLGEARSFSPCHCEALKRAAAIPLGGTTT